MPRGILLQSDQDPGNSRSKMTKNVKCIEIKNKGINTYIKYSINIYIYMAALSKERPFWSFINAQTEQGPEMYWSYIFLI